MTFEKRRVIFSVLIVQRALLAIDSGEAHLPIITSTDSLIAGRRIYSGYLALNSYDRCRQSDQVSNICPVLVGTPPSAFVATLGYLVKLLITERSELSQQFNHWRRHRADVLTNLR
jgi:hypothetical protein